MTETSKIRNFAILAHIDHGKSTLADRFLDITNTIERRKMREQYLDQMELEREKGITIKMQPVKMVYHFDRRPTQNNAQKNAELLYSDLSYQIRGVLFRVRKKIGLGHKEQVYHNALEIEFKKVGLKFESKKNISVLYEGEKIGMYQPDFVVEDKIIIELKALPEIGRSQTEQVWSYLKGCEYKLALLVNFGSKDIEIKRIVYDTARDLSANSSAFFRQRDSASSLRNSAGVSNQIEEFTLNLIDTPGHIDFSYEVSRSLKAVEGAVLLVDATQGVQAQTVSNLEVARSLGLVVVPVVNKIDSPQARIQETKKEIVDILGCLSEDILEVSAKTGENTEKLLGEIIKRIPPPKSIEKSLRGLVFDFGYSVHKGVVLYVRIFDGTIKKGDNVFLYQSKTNFICGEVGIFKPAQFKTEELKEGQIGYVMTNIKEAGTASVGDTLMLKNSTLSPLDGYKQPLPVAWASIYPESQDDFVTLKESLKRLNLSDSALSFEEEESGILGRGFRCGFLGMLHLEIITERIRREFNLDIVVAMPSVVYQVYTNKGEVKTIYSPALFPEFHEIKKVLEPWANLEIITPYDSLNAIIKILKKKDAIIGETNDFGSSRVIIKAQIPLREMMESFFEDLKSVSSGYASYNYELIDSREADLVRLDTVLNDDLVPAFSKIVKRRDMQREAQTTAKRLRDYLPRALFVIKIQVKAQGKILAAQKLSALKKDVTGHLYGGDITRKQKLWKKQKKGKEKLKKFGKVNVPHDVFIKMVKGED